ncbi:hypothetical protein DFH09DRAFT_1088420, partial [Mycena vulgaris]
RILTRTHKYRSGRHAKAMVIPLTADMLAARAAAGFTSHGSKYFCIACHIDMAHIEEFDHTRWEHRSYAQHLQHANAWKNAASLGEQEKLATEYGVRWTPLLKLPYWNVVRYVLVEAMHVLDLRLIDRHCRDLFRFDLQEDGGDGSEHRVLRPPRVSVERETQILQLFQRHRNSPNLMETVLNSPWVTYSAVRDWFVLRIKNWMDANQITDEELLRIQRPDSDKDPLRDLILAATNTISESATNAGLNELDVEECKKLTKALYRGTKFTSLSTKLEIYAHVCRTRNLPSVGTRSQMYDRLIDRIYLQRIPQTGVPFLALIWVGAAPKNWGTKKRGKLSADHWRTIFTVHLPITLIWLWRDETERKRELLFNMTQLVMAIRVANFKETTTDISTLYDTFISTYMMGVAKLFKEDNITPAQHSAFHIGQNLREFGPQHSRGAQFYERYIHFLQRQNTNKKFGSSALGFSGFVLIHSKIGEMETTFMNSAARAANLKALISDNTEIREHVSEAIKAYERGSNRDSRGIRLAYMLDPNDPHFDLQSLSRWSSLSLEERQVLHSYLQWKHGDFNLEDWKASAAIMEQISITGVRYARKNVLKRDQDSNILFCIPGTDEVVPGEILNIFQYWHTTAAEVEFKAIYLLVNRFPTNPVLGRQDPYREHPNLFGYLCGTNPIDTRIIEAEHVQSHFGRTPIEYNGQQLMHVLPLSRVNHEHWWLSRTQDDEDDNEDVNSDDEGLDADKLLSYEVVKYMPHAKMSPWPRRNYHIEDVSLHVDGDHVTVIVVLLDPHSHLVELFGKMNIITLDSHVEAFLTLIRGLLGSEDYTKADLYTGGLWFAALPDGGIMLYFETILKERTLDFIVPHLDTISARDEGIAGTTALVHMNSFVLAIMLKSPNILPLFQALTQAEQECLGQDMIVSGAFASHTSHKSPKTAHNEPEHYYHLRRQACRSSEQAAEDQRLETSLEALQSELHAVKTDRDKYLADIEKMESDFTAQQRRLRERYETAKTAIKNLEDKTHVTSLVLGTSKTDVNELKQDIKNLTKELANKDGIISEMETRLRNEQHDADNSTTLHKKAQAHNIQLQRDLAESDKRVAELTNAQLAWNTEESEIKRDRRSLRVRLEYLEPSMTELRRNLETMTLESTSAKAALEKALEKVSTMSEALDAKMVHIQDLENELSERPSANISQTTLAEETIIAQLRTQQETVHLANTVNTKTADLQALMSQNAMLQTQQAALEDMLQKSQTETACLANTVSTKKADLEALTALKEMIHWSTTFESTWQETLELRAQNATLEDMLQDSHRDVRINHAGDFGATSTERHTRRYTTGFAHGKVMSWPSGRSDNPASQETACLTDTVNTKKADLEALAGRNATLQTEQEITHWSTMFESTWQEASELRAQNATLEDILQDLHMAPKDITRQSGVLEMKTICIRKLEKECVELQRQQQTQRDLALQDEKSRKQLQADCEHLRLEYASLDSSMITLLAESQRTNAQFIQQITTLEDEQFSLLTEFNDIHLDYLDVIFACGLVVFRISGLQRRLTRVHRHVDSPNTPSRLENRIHTQNSHHTALELDWEKLNLVILFLLHSQTTITRTQKKEHSEIQAELESQVTDLTAENDILQYNTKKLQERCNNNHLELKQLKIRSAEDKSRRLLKLFKWSWMIMN